MVFVEAPYSWQSLAGIAGVVRPFATSSLTPTTIVCGQSRGADRYRCTGIGWHGPQSVNMPLPLVDPVDESTWTSHRLMKPRLLLSLSVQSQSVLSCDCFCFSMKR